MERFIKRRATLTQYRQGVLGKYLDLFAKSLSEQGYTRRTACEHLRVAAQFSNWLKCKRIPVGKITSGHVTSYLRAKGECSKNGHALALRQLLSLLRQECVIKEETVLVASGTERLIEEFDHYLRTVRGAAAKTAIHYTWFARHFLRDRFRRADPNLSKVGAEDIIGFVHRQARCYGNRQTQLMTGALRSFFQYARFRGYVDRDLAAAVPAVPRRSVTSVPRALPRDQVELVLNGCNRNTAIGRRDYAVLMLLSRLGVRACEIVSLRLDDIDWQAGSITVRGKGQRSLSLPMPPDVGKALADYLRHGRPNTRSRVLFLRHIAPIRGFKGSQTICSIVRTALFRVGIDSPLKGAHQFRHSLATELLRRGASLSEIGEILGHHRLESTALYAKVDLTSLRAIALPWPGGAQ